MAPIFDTGNSLFYNKEFIPSGRGLLDIQVTSFLQKEVKLLRFITDKQQVDLDKLCGFDAEVEALLKTYTNMPIERTARIAGTVNQKMEYLRHFQQGKKIWKKELYW